MKNRSLKSFITYLRRPISQSDPEIYNAILNQKQRQVDGINLIASQNYCSNACFQAVGSVLNNKYSQGYPGNRYYGGTKYVDLVQSACRQRALAAFKLSPQQWGTNVQALSGSSANFIVYTGLLQPHDRIMGLDLPHGGHLSHGFMSMGKRISATSRYFQSLPYFLNQKTGDIDYDSLREKALVYRPKIIIAGASAYSKLIDYKKMRQICDQSGALLMADMAHPAGLISAGLIPSPFEHAHVVTTTTHKTLRGPKGALIFYRVGKYKNKKGEQLEYDFKKRIDSALFPGLQGGPHNHNIAGIAVALKEVNSEQFLQYQKQVIANIKHLQALLIKKNYQIAFGETQNHLFLLDMRNKGVDGSKMQLILNDLCISTNKNTVPGDKSALLPSGIRIGSPAMTTRGLKEKDFQNIYQFIDRSTILCRKIKQKSKGPKLADFKLALNEQKSSQQFSTLYKNINQFAKQFPIPGGLI